MLFTETMHIVELLSPGIAIEYRLIDESASLTVRQPEWRFHVHDGVEHIDIPPSSAPLPLRALVANGEHRTCIFSTYETQYSVILKRQEDDGTVLASLVRDDDLGRRMELGRFDSDEWDDFINIVASLEKECGRPLELEALPRSAWLSHHGNQQTKVDKDIVGVTQVDSSEFETDR